MSVPEPPPVELTRLQIILCFDGTGNKFTGKDRISKGGSMVRTDLSKGTTSDSNILKIFRMLDRNNAEIIIALLSGNFIATMQFSHSSSHVL